MVRELGNSVGLLEQSCKMSQLSHDAVFADSSECRERYTGYIELEPGMLSVDCIVVLAFGCVTGSDYCRRQVGLR